MYGIGPTTPDIHKALYDAGLRFSFDEEEKMDLRMDIGFGQGTSGVCFAVNQAF